MKTKLTVLSALALVALAACQREATVADNPTYDPVENTVNTQFILNISTGTGSPETKQTAVDVQAGGTNFRGITAAHILTYKLNYSGEGGAHYLYMPADASSQAIRDFDLGDLVDKDDIVTGQENRRILELALPLGTNNILVYGRAPKTSTDDAQGSVTYVPVPVLNSTLENVSFRLNSRIKDSLAFKQFGDLMGRILTGIMNSGLVVETADLGYKVSGGTPRDNTYSFWWPVDDTSKGFSKNDAADAHEGYTKYTGSIRWKDLGYKYDTDPTSLKPLEMVLGEAYSEVMHLKGASPKTELRAGAAASVVRLVSDMFNVIMRVKNTAPTTPEEYIVQLLADEIYHRAGLFFQYDATTSRIFFKTRNEIMDGVVSAIPDRSADDYNKVTEDFFCYSKLNSSDTREEYPGFPLNLNLPMGAAIMSFMTVGNPNDPSHQYDVVVYSTTIPTYGMGTSLPFSVMNYRYPAELVYYTNSSLRTSDSPADKNSFPALSTNWSNNTYWGAAWNKSEVTSTTRAVAVSKTLNYGTALLRSSFAYDDSVIEDNNGGVHTGEENNKIDVSTGSKFRVTGILIGGVSEEVGWDFLPKDGKFNKMIYDRLGENSFYIPVYSDNPDAKYSNPVYTCVWDNYNSTLGADEQSPVYIGLELVNNTGQDIWGELNLIRNGGTFYLVGELNPKTAAVPANMKDANGKINLSRADMFYPPFDENGKTINAPRVFMQDYVTDVKFKFTEDALKHAYVTMPDLRAGQVSLGLSVDLAWTPGLTFEVEMGNVSGN